MKRLAVNLAVQLGPLLTNTRGKQRLSILIYHRVLPRRDPMRPDEPTIDEFDWQMRLLRNHFNPLPLLDALERLSSATLPERTVCVTFDDGYADNEQFALPILQKYQIPATVFVSTGFLNGGRMWNDSVIESIRIFPEEKLDLRELDLGYHSLASFAQRLKAVDHILGGIKHLEPKTRLSLVTEIEKQVTALPGDLMMTDTQIRALARNGVAIGAHTVNHPILSSVSDETARKEIQDSKLYLETLLQERVELFAYPNGKPDLDYRLEHREMVRELGFKAAVSTHWGVSTNESDPFQLPRFTPWDRKELKYAMRLLTSYRWVDPLIAEGR